MPTRAYGNNSENTEDPDLIFLQPSAAAASVLMFGGGVRIQLPNPNVSLRLSAYRTATGRVDMQTPVCDVLGASDPDATDLRALLHCDNPFTEDVTVSELMARVQFKRLSDDGGKLRPTIDLGLGLR